MTVGLRGRISWTCKPQSGVNAGVHRNGRSLVGSITSSYVES
jgi:hypothetical protein